MIQADSPQIQALKERYKSSFPNKVAEINDCINVIQSNHIAPDDVTKLRDLLHKIAGSSGMYGYSEISTTSRSAMRIAESFDDSSELDELVSAVNELIALIESSR